METILITGARAPTALEMARLLAGPQRTIVLADTMHHPLSRASRYVDRYYTVPSPRTSHDAFIEGISEIITTHNVSLLIPTCEEVFFLAQKQDKLPDTCTVFTDSFELLRQMHSKFEFSRMTHGLSITTPETLLLTSKKDLTTLTTPEKYVFKPVYSRFGSYVLFQPTAEELASITPSAETPWVAQAYVSGTEYCTYSIALNGTLQAHSCYEPTYRLHNSSGIYFSPVQKPEITTFVAEFVARTGYTGQIGFDIIQREDGRLFVLECNPRATSGIHLFRNEKNIRPLLTTPQASPVLPKSPPPLTFHLAMVTFGLGMIPQKGLFQFLKDTWRGRNVIFHWSDPFPWLYQVISLFEIIWHNYGTGKTLKETATDDTEWNGESHDS